MTLSWLAGQMATYEAGVIVKNGYAPAASIVAFIYLIGFLGTWLGPETKGRALPEDKDFDQPPAPVPSVSPSPAPQQP